MQTLAVHDCVRSVRMTQIVHAQGWQSGRFPDCAPSPVDVCRFTAGRREHPGTVGATRSCSQDGTGRRREPDRARTGLAVRQHRAAQVPRAWGTPKTRRVMAAGSKVGMVGRVALKHRAGCKRLQLRGFRHVTNAAVCLVGPPAGGDLVHTNFTNGLVRMVLPPAGAPPRIPALRPNPVDALLTMRLFQVSPGVAGSPVPRTGCGHARRPGTAPSSRRCGAPGRLPAPSPARRHRCGASSP